MRRRARALAQAEQELLSARMTKARDNLTLQLKAVHKARGALEEAEAKLRNVKLWIRDYDATLEPLAKALNSLRTYLDHDLPHSIAWLAEAGKIMDAYRDAGAPPQPVPAAAQQETLNPQEPS